MTSGQRRNITHRQNELSQEEARIREELTAMSITEIRAKEGWSVPHATSAEILNNITKRRQELLDRLLAIEEERQFMASNN